MLLRDPIFCNKETPTKKAKPHFTSFSNRWAPEEELKPEQRPESFSDDNVRMYCFERNRRYKVWLQHWMLPSKQHRFQAVRILDWQDSGHDCTKDYWFKMFIEGMFYVYQSPLSLREEKTNKIYQYYLLSPEDAYQVNVELDLLNDKMIPKRSVTDELYISKHQHLTTPRIVPVELCRHVRHETIGGQLPDITPENRKAAVDGL